MAGRAGGLEQLGKVLGLELELEDRNTHVGQFRADILCRDTASNNWVLIENQIERTDHAHLGQILTYAAGLKAVTIVWVATKFTEEHRAALDWLNEVTKKASILWPGIELLRIQDSPIAPRFNVVCKPNDWRTRLVSEATRGQVSSGEQTLSIIGAIFTLYAGSERYIAPAKTLSTELYEFCPGTIKRIL